jgi:hypothetical protein
MTDTSDHPFGSNTARFRATFVRDGSQTTASVQGLQANLGLNPVKLPAVFVREGGNPPGYPFVKIGGAQFRPDSPPDQRPLFTSMAPAGSSQPIENMSDGFADRPPPPPTPSAAYPHSNPLSAGLAVWRGMANFAGARRRAAAGANAAIPPEGDAGDTTDAQ